MNMQGFREELEKKSFDPTALGIIIGVLIGRAAGKKMGKAGEAAAKAFSNTSNIAGPVTGGAVGALLAALVNKGGDTTSNALLPVSMPTQSPLRRLSVEGANNVYGQPGYNPRF